MEKNRPRRCSMSLCTSAEVQYSKTHMDDPKDAFWCFRTISGQELTLARPWGGNILEPKGDVDRSIRGSGESLEEPTGQPESPGWHTHHPTHTHIIPGQTCLTGDLLGVYGPGPGFLLWQRWEKSSNIQIESLKALQRAALQYLRQH